MPEAWEYEKDERGHPIGIWATGRFAYITDLRHSRVRAAYDERCRVLGLRPWDSLSRRQRVQLDLALVERFGVDKRTPADVIRALTLPPYAGIKKAPPD